MMMVDNDDYGDDGERIIVVQSMEFCRLRQLISHFQGTCFLSSVNAKRAHAKSEDQRSSSWDGR
eukprot:93518-Hanusia_phi.AAC.2